MKRIVAVVLPKLACEVARYRTMATPSIDPRAPVAALLDRGDDRAPATATLDVIEDEARKYGVRPGQRVAEATALLSSLVVHRVPIADVEAELGRVAEVLFTFAPTVAIKLSNRAIEAASSLDTVWLDITGAAHLAGGEAALLDEIVARASSLGHAARVAIAGGPRLAEGLARFGDGGEDYAALPLRALAMDGEIASWFLRLGVLTIGDLAKLPRAEVRARLGARAAEIVDLLDGHDDVPLLPYAPPRFLDEEILFDEPVNQGEPLLFVLRAMTSRLSARLAARGEACARIEVTLPVDRSIAKLRGHGDDVKASSFAVDLPAPLVEAVDLLRALKPSIDRLELPAPAIAVRVVVPQIVRAERVQLDLSRDRAASPDNLPALLAELAGDIGKDRLGVLATPAEHLPEHRSKKVPWRSPSPGASEEATPVIDANEEEPTRILARPIPIAGVKKGAVIAAGGRLWSVDRSIFLERLDDVAWWSEHSASRDYLRLWLASGASVASAFVFVDRRSREAFLQGWFE